MNVDLQSHEKWSPPFTSYFIYGSALSEVRIHFYKFLWHVHVGIRKIELPICVLIMIM